MLLVGVRLGHFCVCMPADLESLSVSSSVPTGAAAKAKGEMKRRWARPSDPLLPLLLESFWASSAGELTSGVGVPGRVWSRPVLAPCKPCPGCECDAVVWGLAADLEQQGKVLFDLKGNVDGSGLRT